MSKTLKNSETGQGKFAILASALLASTISAGCDMSITHGSARQKALSGLGHTSEGTKSDGVVVKCGDSHEDPNKRSYSRKIFHTYGEIVVDNIVDGATSIDRDGDGHSDCGSYGDAACAVRSKIERCLDGYVACVEITPKTGYTPQEIRAEILADMGVRHEGIQNNGTWVGCEDMYSGHTDTAGQLLQNDADDQGFCSSRYMPSTTLPQCKVIETRQEAVPVWEQFLLSGSRPYVVCVKLGTEQ